MPNVQSCPWRIWHPVREATHPQETVWRWGRGTHHSQFPEEKTEDQRGWMHFLRLLRNNPKPPNFLPRAHWPAALSTSVQGLETLLSLRVPSLGALGSKSPRDNPKHLFSVQLPPPTSPSCQPLCGL